MPRLFTVGSIVTHTVVVGGVIAAQALAVGPLPTPQMPLTFGGAIQVRIADIPLPRRPLVGQRPTTPPDANFAPVVAPPTIREETGLEGAPASSNDIGFVESGMVPGGLGTVVVDTAPPPPPAPPTTVPARIGGRIAPPRKIAQVDPVYPALARTAHVSGIVILETTIDARGRVIDVVVLRSIPLLDQAAVDAVRQWVYTPTLLNGVAVPVVMTVTVTFTLGQP